MKAFVLLAMLAAGGGTDSCDENSSDSKQSQAQEQILLEGTAQTGMPAIVNFRERKLLKSIIEMRDQANLTTYTYTYAENTGKGSGQGYIVVLPQADPNGLFSPASADGTWVMCKDPKGPDVKPVYVEPRVITSPFPLDDDSPVVEVPAISVKAAQKP